MKRRSPAPRNSAARALRRSIGTCGMRPPGCPCGRNRERRGGRSGRSHRSAPGCWRTSRRSRSGSRRSDRRRRRCRDGATGRGRRRRWRRPAEWRRFMRFRIMSSPAWRLRWRCGISRGSSAISRHRSSSISTGSSDERRRRSSSGHGGQQPPDHLAQGRPARQIGAIGRQIDAGHHDLAEGRPRPTAASRRRSRPSGPSAPVHGHRE